MRQNLQDSDAQQLGIYSGRLGSTRQVLDGSATLTREGSLLNFFDPGGANRDVFLPAMERGRFYIVANVGSADELIVKDSGGTQLTYLRSFETVLLVCSGDEWTALRGWEDLDVFTINVDGLVPHPGPGSPGQLFLRNDGQWAQVQVSGIVDAFKFITDGTNTAVGNGPDTLWLHSSDDTIIATVANNDPVFGDSVDFAVNEAAVDHDALLNFVADEHVAHASVTLTAGEGLVGGGNISASRTFDLALTELLVDAASVLVDVQLAGTNGAGLNRIFEASYLNSILVHDNLSGFSANRHIDHTTVSMIAGIGLSGGGDISVSRTFNLDFTELETGEAITTSDLVPFYDMSESDHNTVTFLQFNQTLDHDTLTGFVADEHIAHSGVTFTAGAGLTGGGTIAASRTFDVGAGTGITVNANDVALDTTNTRNVDHAAVSVLAGAGLTGGGTIAADRTLALDINGQAADATPDNAADYVIEWDASASGFKKVLISNLVTTLARFLLLTGTISPAQITSDQNNYAPTGLHTSSVVRLSTDASRAITGLDAGSAGELKLLLNVGSFDFTLPDESGSSTAANRFAVNATVTVATKQGVILIYDGTSSRWRVIGSTSSGGGSFDINSLTEETTLAAGDFAPVYDVSASAQRKVTISNIYKAINILTGEAAIASADTIPFYDDSATAPRKVTFAQFKTALALATIATSGSASDLASGTVPTARLGSGTADATSSLRGDQTYQKGAWRLLGTLTASSSATLGDTSILSSTYEEYELIFDNLYPATDSVQLCLQVRSGGSYQTSSYISNYGGNAGGSTSFGAGNSTARIPLGLATLSNSAGSGASGFLRVHRPANTTQVKVFFGTMYGAQSVAWGYNVSGIWNNTGAITGFQVFMSSGNIASGSVRIYGR